MSPNKQFMWRELQALAPLTAVPYPTAETHINLTYTDLHSHVLFVLDILSTFDALSNWNQEKCLAGYGDVYYFNPSTSEAEARGFLSAKPSWSTWKDPLKKWGGKGRDEGETLKKAWRTVWRVHGHTWLSALGWVYPNWCSGDSSREVTQASGAHGHSVLVLPMRCYGA